MPGLTLDAHSMTLLPELEPLTIAATHLTETLQDQRDKSARSAVLLPGHMSLSNRSLLPICFLVAARVCGPQTTGATFGDVIRLGGTPSDIVLDESRSRLYLVNSNTGAVDIYDYANKFLAGSIRVGSTPVAAAISMDSKYLYVSNNASSTLSVIDLSASQVLQTVSLPSKPE